MIDIDGVVILLSFKEVLTLNIISSIIKDVWTVALDSRNMTKTYAVG
jgi:hypothetical protein